MAIPDLMRLGRGEGYGAGPWIVLALLLGAVLALAAALAWSKQHRAAPAPEAIAAAYAAPLPAPAGPLRVFHLGHSLVGRDLPAMLQQLAGPGHRYDVQLGWGTPLRAHWEDSIEINGFAEENAHDRYRNAKAALISGDYGAFVATEMVEIRDAIAYHASGRYLGKWAALARQGNPEIRIYLYETWPRLDDPEGWLDRLDRDLARHWEAEVLAPALPALAPDKPILVIPAGQVFAAFVRAVEDAGGVDNIAGREALFREDADGARDPIHLNDLGTYLAALTHYTVLYHRSPVGLPHRLLRADGTPADAPGPEAARLMQETVWRVVTGYPKSGLGAGTTP